MESPVGPYLNPLRRERQSSRLGSRIWAVLLLAGLLEAGRAAPAFADKPDVDLNGEAGGKNTSAAFTEDGGPITLAPLAEVTHTDNIDSATVTITNLQNGASESLSADVGATGITASYNSATGVLTLTGSSGAANYQTVFRTVKYNNTSQNPTTAPPRFVEFVATHAGATTGGPPGPPAPTATVTISAVNDAPQNSVPGPQTTLEDAALVLSPSNGNAISVADVDAGPGSIGVSLSVTNGALTLGTTAGLTFTAGANGTATMTFDGTISAINAALNGLTFTPAANYNGSAALTITSDDKGKTGSGGVLTDTDTVAITVTAVNDPPALTKGPDQVVAEDAGPQTAPAWATAISPGPADESGQTVTFTVTTTNAALFSALPAVGPTGTLTYTTAPNANGSATVTVVVRDNGGTANGGVDTSAPQSFLITVSPVNDVPVANDGTATTGEGTAVAIDLGALASDVETADANLTYTIASGPSNGTLSGAGQTRTYTPNANFNGADSFTYSVTDRGDPDNCGAPSASCAAAQTSAIQTVTMTVSPVNEVPVAAGDSYSVVQGGTLKVGAPGVLSNDTDVDGDTLTARLLKAPNFAAGFEFRADGSFTYTASTSFRGADTFTYVATDGRAVSQEAEVAIEVVPLNIRVSRVGSRPPPVEEEAPPGPHPTGPPLESPSPGAPDATPLPSAPPAETLDPGAAPAVAGTLWLVIVAPTQVYGATADPALDDALWVGEPDEWYLVVAAEGDWLLGLWELDPTNRLVWIQLWDGVVLTTA